jgi:hypothetical protein
LHNPVTFPENGLNWESITFFGARKPDAALAESGAPTAMWTGFGL